MTRIEEINQEMLKEFAANNIPNTTEHRIWFLEGLQDGWKEDPDPIDLDQSIEKSLYMMALGGELLILRMRLARTPTTKE